MFAMNKETMMMVAIAIALLASFYLYKENQKTKSDFESFKDILNTPPPAPPPAPVVAPAPKKKREVPAAEAEE